MSWILLMVLYHPASGRIDTWESIQVASRQACINAGEQFMSMVGRHDRAAYRCTENVKHNEEALQ